MTEIHILIPLIAMTALVVFLVIRIDQQSRALRESLIAELLSLIPDPTGRHSVYEQKLSAEGRHAVLSARAQKLSSDENTKPADKQPEDPRLALDYVPPYPGDEPFVDPPKPFGGVPPSIAISSTAD